MGMLLSLVWLSFVLPRLLIFVSSLVQSDYRTRTYGTSHTIGDLFRREFFEHRRGVRNILGRCGFQDFVLNLTSQSYSLAPKISVFGLMEWFWHTTNTFHFPWWQMVVTPYDFAMLTVLTFTENLIPLDNEIRISDPRLDEWLGPIASSLRV